MNKAFLSIGSNQGDRFDHLEKARKGISEFIGDITKTSSVYETAAWGFKNQADFLNRVFEVSTELKPLEIMEFIERIETELGRVRYKKWGMRKIDIDILFYNDAIIMTDHLKIPHPLLQDRKFVLVPLNEIGPELIHPVLNKSVRKLLELCKDELGVRKMKSAKI